MLHNDLFNQSHCHRLVWQYAIDNDFCRVNPAAGRWKKYSASVYRSPRSMS